MGGSVTYIVRATNQFGCYGQDTITVKLFKTGADIFVQQGAHRGVGGVEIYKNKVIMYDPGDFIKMSDTTTRIPIDFYLNEQYAEYGHNLRDWNATPSEAFDARAKAELWKELKPEIDGSVVAICVFGVKNCPT